MKFDAKTKKLSFSICDCEDEGKIGYDDYFGDGTFRLAMSLPGNTSIELESFEIIQTQNA